MVQHIEDLKKIIQNYYSERSYAILAEGRKWDLNTPEAEKMDRNDLPVAFGDTLTHCAMIVGKSHLKEWQAENIEQGFLYFELKIFKNINEACSWLTLCGFDTRQLAR